MHFEDLFARFLVGHLEQLGAIAEILFSELVKLGLESSDLLVSGGGINFQTVDCGLQSTLFLHDG